MLNWKTKIRLSLLYKISGLLIGGLIFFASCQPDHNPLESRQVFRYNEVNGIGSLDPAFAKDLALINACEQLFNGLVQLDSNLIPIASIAKSWQLSEDFLLYTFTLNNRVYYHDNQCFKDSVGRRVSAKDFVFSFNRILDSKLGSPGLWVFNMVDKSWKENGFNAPNDSVFQIKLKQPYTPFLSLLSMKYCSVIPHEAIEFYADDFRRNPVGTGPFILKYWEEGLKLVLVKNTKYFEQGLPYLDAISISFLADKQSEFLLFLQNNLDFISGYTPSLKDEILTETGELNPKYIDEFKMYKMPYLNTEYIGILVDTSLEIVKQSPLKNLSFRQALNYAIDKKKMLYYLQNNVGEAAHYGFIPSGLWPMEFERAKGYSFQEKKAEELFAIALTELGIDQFPPIKLSATSKSIDLCKYIQHQWAEFGIITEIELNQWAALKEMVANSKVALFRASWIADYPDPENYLLLFNSELFSPKGPNYTHFYSKDYNMQLKNSNFALTLKDKYYSYRIMDSLILANASVIPLYYDEVLRFVQPEIIGFEPNPMNLMVLKYVSKKKYTFLKHFVASSV